MDKESQAVNLEELRKKYSSFSTEEKSILNEVLKFHAEKAHIKNPDLVNDIVKIIKGQIK